MDKETRNTLRNVVTRCRQLLEEAIAQVLEGQYGVYKTGRVEDAARMGHLSEDDLAFRERTIAHLEHIQAGGFKPADATDQLIREIAFTHLNRLAAYKMMEQRSLIRETVSRGLKSQGFMFYLANHPDDERLWSTGQQDIAYRHFLIGQGEQFADEITVLFSSHDPANFVFPPQRVLDQVLDLINNAELADIWTADETIGWIYQYFTPKELRDKARSESQAPRNSYELAFRNQFYTPRYVVEFLTDNTLGRTWYEMRQGRTVLTDQCRYLVRRPNEIFLAQSEDAPESDVDTSALSQEELLQQPVYIPYRAPKDPRRLKVLDPACGSGHFLLYAFDLLATIYEEAWQDDLTDPAAGMNLRGDYATQDALRCHIPRLILRHNLHGIDIDRRATQIAALALWLRAQRYYNDHAIKRDDRPAITQGNIVVAEPMPGDRALLDEFTAQLEPPIDQMVKRVFNEMKLAGEAGSLLKVEEAIQDDIATARREWERGLREKKTHQQLALLPDWIEKKPEQLSLFDVSKITDAEFFDRAERMVLEALEAYAQQAENGHGLRRRLFADDAASGFAFIDLVRAKFDIVVMNPPFGDMSLSSRSYIEQRYPTCAHDIYPAFIERGTANLTHGGILGAITNRTGLLLGRFEEWRKEFFLGKYVLRVVADLGHGVLDSALVETAAYCIEKKPLLDGSDSAVFLSTLGIVNRERDLSICELRESLSQGEQKGKPIFIRRLKDFFLIPSTALAYSFSPQFLNLFSKHDPLESGERHVKVTNQTSDDFKYLRLRWEIPVYLLGKELRWVSYAKGGEYSPYYADLHLVVDWDEKRGTYRGFEGTEHRTTVIPASVQYFFLPGLTYSSRTASNFSPRILPAECIFSNKGPYIGGKNREDNLFLLGLMMCRVFQAFVDMRVGAGDSTSAGTASRSYDVGILQQIPLPSPDQVLFDRIADHTRQIVDILRDIDRIDETTSMFQSPVYSASKSSSLTLAANQQGSHILSAYMNALDHTWEIEKSSHLVYALQDDMLENIVQIAGVHPLQYPSTVPDDSTRSQIHMAFANPLTDIVQQAVGETGGHRNITVKSYYMNRTIEVLSHVFQLSPQVLVKLERETLINQLRPIIQISQDIISYSVGIILGRWDVRCGQGKHQIAEPTDPFSPLPVCSTGMLQNADGLPATATPPGYPLDIDWDGILVDDPDHPDDIIRRVRGVLEVLWGDRAEAIEQEACEILGVKDLRDYFRRPGSGGFWIDHIKRYSKSRRNAPIYWLLQSSRKNYALWLYYHRLDKDLYYKALINYVQPKLRREQNNLDALRAQLAGVGITGREAKRLEREVEQQEALMSELQDFHDALERAANLNLDPDLNDGVVLNIAPLRELVPWAEAQKYWDELFKGEYEWSTISQQLRERGKIK